MTDDIKKDSNYWSQYDFTQIPYDDIVKVGQRTLLYRDLFSVSWLLDVSVITNVVTVILTQEVIEKTIDRQNYVGHNR